MERGCRSGAAWSLQSQRAAEKGGCCREGVSPASCRVPRQKQTIGSDPNRGMAFGQSLLSRAPRHARVKFGDEFDRREIERNASATYDPAGIIVVASAWLAFYVAAVIHLL